MQRHTAHGLPKRNRLEEAGRCGRHMALRLLDICPRIVLQHLRVEQRPAVPGFAPVGRRLNGDVQVGLDLVNCLLWHILQGKEQGYLSNLYGMCVLLIYISMPSLQGQFPRWK